MLKKLRIVFLLIASLFITGMASAQEATWKSSVEHLEGNEYRIVLEASIPEGFHMYDLGPYENGPAATEIKFDKAEGVQYLGAVEMLDKPHRAMDEIFEMEIGTFEGVARFAQKIRLNAASASVKASIYYQICMDGACMTPTDVDLTIDLKQADGVDLEKILTENPVVEEPVVEEPAKEEATISEAKEEKGGSIWAYILEAVIWGFVAMLTPCVFPMIPMTVSFFMHGSENPAMGRFRAMMYGFFIVLLYTLPIAAIILITRIVGGDAVTADIFNWLATHWLPNIIFFLVFMAFAASFFGAFEITMPSWMVNKSDSHADNKGLGGIFFMALTLVLVSFSCTGPIVGSVLIKSTAGEFWTPIITIMAFSITFALPFTFFALFPSMLKKMPKSGGWLNSVKVVLGFIEVALGFKFLSMADMTYHWRLLDREVYLAIWIATFTLLGLYLLGKIRFSHDSEFKHMSVGRLILTIITFTFVVYMLPGMWGAPLKALSGYLPPITTQDFNLSMGGTIAAAPANTLTTVDGKAPKYSDFLHMPYNLQAFFDIEEAEAYAKKVDKPIFIDFSGHGCVNCREMETRVWSDPAVLKMLREDFVLCVLYADDKTELPEEDHVTTETGKVLTSLGKINSHFVTTNFAKNAQPYYFLVSPEKPTELLVEARGYDLSIEGFIEFLNNGKKAYKASK